MPQTKILLDEGDLPKAWYNILPDLPEALAPPLHSGTKQPVGPADLAPLFPQEIIKQEVATDREIEIPEPVRESLAAHAAAPGPAVGASAGDPGAHLLQV